MFPTTPSTVPKLRLVHPVASAVPVSHDQRVQLLIDTLTAHLDQPHTLKTLAALIERSPRQCERLFKDEMGQSPLQYLHDLRLAQACDLLVTGFKNVTEIAEAVGFENVNYFIRVFKARYDCTPLAYRKRSAGEVVAKKIA